MSPSGKPALGTMSGSLLSNYDIQRCLLLRVFLFNVQGTRSQRECSQFLSTYAACRIETMTLTKESHFIARLQTEGVKLPKTVDHLSVSNRSAAFCLQRLGTISNIIGRGIGENSESQQKL